MSRESLVMKIIEKKDEGDVHKPKWKKLKFMLMASKWKKRAKVAKYQMTDIAQRRFGAELRWQRKHLWRKRNCLQEK